MQIWKLRVHRWKWVDNFQHTEFGSSPHISSKAKAKVGNSAELPWQVLGERCRAGAPERTGSAVAPGGVTQDSPGLRAEMLCSQHPRGQESNAGRKRDVDD